MLRAAWRYREVQKGKETDRRSRRHVARFMLVALYTGTRSSAVCGAAASGVNYGGVRVQGRSPEQLPLALRSRQIWQRLPGFIGIDGEYVPSGHLKLARSEADLASLRAYARRVEGLGLELQLIEGAEFRRRYPWLGASAIGASWCPGDGHANPRLVSPAFARAAPSVVRLLPLLGLARPRPVTPFYPVLSDALQGEFSAAIAGLRPPGEALVRAQARFDHAVAGLA